MTACPTLLREILMPRVTRGRDGRVDHATAIDMLAAILTISQESRAPERTSASGNGRRGGVTAAEV